MVILFSLYPLCQVKRRRSSSHSGGDHQSLPAAKSPVMDGRPTVSIASVPTSASSSSQVPISSGLSIPSKLSYPSGRFSHSGPKHRHTYSERHYNKHQSPVYPNNSYAYARAILNQLQKPWQFQQPANAMGLNTALNNRCDIFFLNFCLGISFFVFIISKCLPFFL